MGAPVAESISYVILKLEIFVLFSNHCPHATVEFWRVVFSPDRVGHGDGGYGVPFGRQGIFSCREANARASMPSKFEIYLPREKRRRRQNRTRGVRASVRPSLNLCCSLPKQSKAGWLSPSSSAPPRLVTRPFRQGPSLARF